MKGVKAKLLARARRHERIVERMGTRGVLGAAWRTACPHCGASISEDRWVTCSQCHGPIPQRAVVALGIVGDQNAVAWNRALATWLDRDGVLLVVEGLTGAPRIARDYAIRLGISWELATEQALNTHRPSCLLVGRGAEAWVLSFPVQYMHHDALIPVW